MISVFKCDRVVKYGTPESGSYTSWADQRALRTCRGSRNIAFYLSAWLALVFFVGAVALPVPAVAQGTAKQDKSESQKRLSVAGARKAIGDAKAMVAKGDHAGAIPLLTRAIDSRRLRQKEMAMALYQRGLAHRASGGQAKAIADFTSALWIKNGLGASDREAALAARAETYRQAGLSSQGQGNTAAVPQVAAQVAATANATAQTTSRAAASQVPGSSIGTNVTNFFSNIWGGLGASSGLSPATTASLPSSARDPGAAATSVARAATPRRRQQPAVSGWTSQTIPSAQTSSAARPTPQPQRSQQRLAAAAPAARGTVRMQVTAVREKPAADRIASDVRRKYGRVLTGQSVQVREVEIAGFGRLFRVELGPFASEAASRNVCGQLIKDGLDCLRIR